MAVGAHRKRMLQLERESPNQSSVPVTPGGRSIRRRSKSWKKADSDGITRKVRGVGIAAIRSKKHKFTGVKKKKKA